MERKVTKRPFFLTLVAVVVFCNLVLLVKHSFFSVTFLTGSQRNANGEGLPYEPREAVQHLKEDEKDDSSVSANIDIPPNQVSSGLFLLRPNYISKGMNNYKAEMRMAALFANELNRTLWLPPIVHGKTGDTEISKVNASDIYDLVELSKFVEVITEAPFGFEELKRETFIIDCGLRPYSTVSKPRLSKDTLLEMDAARMPLVIADGCFASHPKDLGRFHEEFQELWHHLKPPAMVRQLAAEYQDLLFGKTPFVSFHWRFEETKCRNHQLGLCHRVPGGNGKRTIDVAVQDMVDSIVLFAKGRPVLLATDGRYRKGGSQLVDMVMQRVKDQSIKIVQIPTGLPSSLETQVEQALSMRSSLHIGNSLSTWDSEIFWTLAHRRWSDWSKVSSYFDAANRIHTPEDMLPDGSPFAFLDQILQARVVSAAQA